jgi:hypothetical protein
MSRFLKQEESGMNNFNAEEIKKMTLDVWRESARLSGYVLATEKNIAQLFESEANHLLNETVEEITTQEGIDFHIRRYNAEMNKEYNQSAMFHLTKCIHLMHYNIKEKHCE